MPKRKAEDKIKRYKEKIKRIQEKQKVHKDRRNIIMSDSDSDIGNQYVQRPENYNIEDVEIMHHDYPNIQDESLLTIPVETPLSSTSVMYDPLLSQTCMDKGSKNDCESSEAQNPLLEQIIMVPETSNEVSIELDPEIRLALGDPIEDSPKYGVNVHNDLAQRWLPILKKGLTKDVKENLLKEHHIPDNCRLLKSPSLNPEIAAAVAETVRNRDKKMEVKQNQLGLGITAISRAMENIINDGSKITTIRYLSEGCKILTDLHYVETQIRTKCITPCLDKSILNIIQEEERDEFLFGSRLSEKIKAAKAIEKQGSQIKRNIPHKNNQNQSQSRGRYTGNWTPPSRYPSSSSRGGRGAYMTNRVQPNRQFRPLAPQAPPSTAQSQARAATFAKQRAQTRQ